MGIMDAIGGIFEKSINTIIDVGKNVFNWVGSAVETFSNKATEVVNAVKEGDFEKVINIAADTVSGLVDKVNKLGKIVVEGVGKILDVAIEGVSEIAKSVAVIGKAVIDKIKEHPIEGISTIFSFLAAAVSFRFKHVASGISYLSSGILKGIKLINELPSEKAEMYNNELPEQFRSLYERHKLKEKEYDYIDKYAADLSKKKFPE